MKNLEWVTALLGLCFCLCLVLAPDLYAAIVGQDGYVWTPIHSPLYRGNDGYYYSAWVVEGIQSGFPSGSPSAAEYLNKPLMETIRWFPLAVAALPSYLFSDFRVVYVLDYVFTVCLLFGIPFYLAYRFTKSSRGGLLAGVIVLFYSGMTWDPLKLSKMLVNLPDPLALPSLRYIHLSISGPILMAYILLCHWLYTKTTRSPFLIGAVLLLLSPCMAFSYPSHTVIACAALGGYAALSFLRNRKREAVILVTIGALTALTLLLGDYIDFVRHTINENQMWANVFNNETLTLVDKPWWTLIRMAFLNKYTLSFALALWLAKRNGELLDMVALLGGMAFLCNLTTLFSMPQFSVRFLSRGIEQLWMTVFVTACLLGWKDLIKPLIFFRAPRLAGVMEAISLLLILILPAAGIGAYTLKSFKTLSHFMPQSRWDALQWIAMNVPPNETIAALDWDDITFVPVYTHTNLAMDNMIIGGRGPEDEMERYAALWKIIGFPREKLELRIKEAVETAIRWQHQSTSQLFESELLEPELYATGQVATMALYWPSVTKVWNKDISHDGKTSQSVVSRVMALYDSVDSKSALKEYRISWIVLSGAEQNLPFNAAVPLEPVFKNRTHSIYKVLN